MLGGATVGEFETVPGMLTARWRIRPMSTVVPLYACMCDVLETMIVRSFTIV